MAATPDGGATGSWPPTAASSTTATPPSGLGRPLPLNKPVVGMAGPLGGGYYLVASDGGIFASHHGPPFYGSTGSIELNKPIVGMTRRPGGYYLSVSDGGVFTYPTTTALTFFGSTGIIVLNQPIVGIAA